MTASQISTTRLVGAVTLAPALPGDVPAILDLGRAVHLPPEGVAETLAYFWIAREGERLIGTIGIEVYDDLALLRSLAVTPPRQHTGLGSVLTETALAYLTTRQFRAVYLLTTTATQLWFYRHGPRHPVLVAEAGHSIAGWASLHTFNARPAYQYVADLSIYLARPWRGKGLGARLLQALTPLARELGYHKIVLSAFPTNAAGMRLYARQGFTTVGIYKEMGLVDGRWVDTV